MNVTTNLGDNYSAILMLDSDSIIIREISIWDLSGNLLIEKEFSVFSDKNVHKVHLPALKNQGVLLLFISTSCGNYSQLIN